jgi:hypothetical protein
MKSIWRGDPKKGMSRAALAASLSLLLILGATAGAGCRGKKVSLEFEPKPDTVIVGVEADGGLPHPGDDLYPLFQLFGDGRVITYRGGADGGGVLMQGKLSQEDMAGMLQGLADTGFFDLEDEYLDPEVYDATYRKITVNLVETEKSVMVWAPQRVPRFDAAYNLILDYPLNDVIEYVPEKGYLVVVKYPREAAGGQSLLDPSSEIYAMLPDTATLSAAADGHTAVAVAGGTFTKLKKYDSGQEGRGFAVALADGYLAVYPVYEPRTAKRP